MKVIYTAVLAALVGTSAAAKDETTFAVLRFTSKQLTKGRIDPIVYPGQASAHVHNIMGGSNFGLTSTGKDIVNSKCSNAMVKGDNSNYWFPALYFKDPDNGTIESVEVDYVNAYYFFEKSHDDIKAFPVGMAMVSGNASTRVVPEAGADGNLDPSKGPINPARWDCPRLDNIYEPPNWPKDSDGSMAGIGHPVDLGSGCGFPDQDCDGLYSPLRADVHFPSCYNPEAGLMAYTENMAWPTDNGDGGLDCPKGWIHVPHIFLEVYWNTNLFKDRWTPGKGRQPFILSSGDATGYSSHADFMAGWDEELLQHIIDTCNTGTTGMDNCPGLFYGLNEGECSIESPIDERVDGTFESLPGNNPIRGWWYGLDGTGSGSGSIPSYGASTSNAGMPTTPEASSVGFGEPAATGSVSGAALVESAQVTATSEALGPATTLEVKPVRSSCSRRVHTVWETITVTASETAAPTPDTKLHRHIHDHAHRHHKLRH